MDDENFDRNVFINCPFDSDYEPILQAILFVLIYLGFSPRIATEEINSGAVRLTKISELILVCRFSIHDLSRCQSSKKGEHYRLNMPFELGLDCGCRSYHGGRYATKSMLVLEERPFRYQAAISDIAGCDIKQHGGDFARAARAVRNWLVSEAGIAAEGAARIMQRYVDFQEWYYQKQLVAGFSDDDIRDYPTRELLDAMREWVGAGKPL